MLSDKAYKVLKYISLVFLDGFGIFYKTIAEIWSLPYGNEVLATCAALSTFIGVLIGISSYRYNKPTAQELEWANRDEEVGTEV